MDATTVRQVTIGQVDHFHVDRKNDMSPIRSNIKAHDNPFYDTKDSSPKRVVRNFAGINRFNNVSTPTRKQIVPTETTAP